MNPNIAGIIAVLIFSVGSLLYVLGIEVPPFQFLALQFFLGSFTITIFEIIRGKAVLQQWRQPLKAYLFTSLGIGVYNFLLLTAFHMGPAFEINMLNYLWPVLIVVFSSLAFKNSLSKSQISGIFYWFYRCRFFYSFPHRDNYYRQVLHMAISWLLPQR